MLLLGSCKTGYGKNYSSCLLPDHLFPCLWRRNKNTHQFLVDSANDEHLRIYNLRNFHIKNNKILKRWSSRNVLKSPSLETGKSFFIAIQDDVNRRLLHIVFRESRRRNNTTVVEFEHNFVHLFVFNIESGRCRPKKWSSNKSSWQVYVISKSGVLVIHKQAGCKTLGLVTPLGNPTDSPPFQWKNPASPGCMNPFPWHIGPPPSPCRFAFPRLWYRKCDEPI